MAVGVRTRLRGAGTTSNRRAGSPGDFWRRQRLLRDAPARRLQREGPTRTQFPSAPARMAPSTSRRRPTWMNEKSLSFAKKGNQAMVTLLPIKKISSAGAASRQRSLQQVTTVNTHAPYVIIGERMA